jgi:hypothetical protein
MGNIAELRVALLFARWGYSIFFPLGSPTADFIATQGNEVNTVQVKKATWQEREKCFAVKLDMKKYASSMPKTFAFVSDNGVYLIDSSLIKNRRALRLGPKYPEFYDYLHQLW